MLPKIRALRRLCDERGLATIIEVDGGIGGGNAWQVIEAGAGAIVAGSAVFGAPDYAAAIAAIRQFRADPAMLSRNDATRTRVTRLKRAAAERAVEFVESGMVLGLGTGSTAAFVVEALARRVAQGLSVVAIPTSEHTAEMARGLGIPLATFGEHRRIDLAIDGADEVERGTPRPDQGARRRAAARKDRRGGERAFRRRGR